MSLTDRSGQLSAVRSDQAGDEPRHQAEREQDDHPANNPHDTSQGSSGIVGGADGPWEVVGAPAGVTTEHERR